MELLSLIGRDKPLFANDLDDHSSELSALISRSRILVIGGAGSIGQAVTREIFKRDPAVLHVVDISENNMVELVRDIRSTIGYGAGEFKTFTIDCGSDCFEALVKSTGAYDYIFNLSALKHVRSEKDPFTLMRMLEVNIFNTIKTIRSASSDKTKKYFCVSTDKAVNPVNIMGASKRIMEMFLMRESLIQPISMARFANVAFSDGSLLHGFNMRFTKRQPISAPNDVRRYFFTPQESGELCLLSCLLGKNREVFFPKLNDRLNLIAFSDIAIRYLENLGYEPHECSTEEEARRCTKDLIPKKRWPCYFFKSDTTGEKGFEEFFTSKEEIDMGRFDGVGVIQNQLVFDEVKLNRFALGIETIRSRQVWTRAEIIALVEEILPELAHAETGKYLDERM